MPSWDAMLPWLESALAQSRLSDVVISRLFVRYGKEKCWNMISHTSYGRAFAVYIIERWALNSSNWKGLGVSILLIREETLPICIGERMQRPTGGKVRKA